MKSFRTFLRTFVDKNKHFTRYNYMYFKCRYQLAPTKERYLVTELKDDIYAVYKVMSGKIYHFRDHSRIFDVVVPWYVRFIFFLNFKLSIGKISFLDNIFGMHCAVYHIPEYIEPKDPAMDIFWVLFMQLKTNIHRSIDDGYNFMPPAGLDFGRDELPKGVL